MRRLLCVVVSLVMLTTTIYAEPTIVEAEQPDELTNVESGYTKDQRDSLKESKDLIKRVKRSVNNEGPILSDRGALLHCDSMLFDFGVVSRKRGEISHTFVIENRGDAPLVITRVERSCSCLKTSISKRPIAVGERRILTVTYEVKKMPPGLFSKVVQIYSNSRDMGFAQFTITGRSVSRTPNSNMKI